MTSDARRAHVVLVPGFGGFDALGQLEYYAGVTPVFERWREAHALARVSLHYFDNLPTAGVEIRARLLRAFLAKRCLRKEFEKGDRLILVGHSTGGLDIRQLLSDLRSDPGTPLEFDCARDAMAAGLTYKSILKLVDRLVFLSVPQIGTNIADWVRTHHLVVKPLVEMLWGAMAWPSHLPRADVLGDLAMRLSAWTEQIAGWDEPDIFLAARDVLAESFYQDEREPFRTARARAAHAEVMLWLNQMKSDWRIIDDLSSDKRLEGPSIARLSPAERQAEKDWFAERGIATRSYATVGRCPFDPALVRLDEGELRSVQSLRHCFTGAPKPHTDLTYRLLYWLCSAGPLQEEAPKLRVKRFDGDGDRTFEAWENDGVVNTASMLWPDGENTHIIEADHGDVIGHYDLKPARAREERRHQAYDLLASSSGFEQPQFEQLWTEVFDFCLGFDLAKRQ